MHSLRSRSTCNHDSDVHRDARKVVADVCTGEPPFIVHSPARPYQGVHCSVILVVYCFVDI